MTIERYSCAVLWEKNQTEVTIQPDKKFRVIRIVTNIENSEQAFLDALYVDESNELMGRIDLYQFSQKLQEILIEEFLNNHNLKDKTDEQIQDYLDENELEYPSTTRLMLPIGKKYRFIGETKTDFNIVLIGMVLPNKRI